jgi:hypothetical protein
MPQTGYTSLKIYSSSTATNVPNASNLVNDTSGSELAINIVDEKLYFKNNSGVVKLLASVTSTSGVYTTQATGDNSTKVATTAFVQTALQLLYPVGSLYINTAGGTNPAILFGFGTWVAFGSGRVMIGQDGATYPVGAIGGSATTTISTTNLPSHTHTFSGSVSTYGTGSTNGAYTGIYDAGHAHGFTLPFGPVNNSYSGGGAGLFGGGNYGYATDGAQANIQDPTHAHSFGVSASGSFSGTTGGTGSGTAITTISPYIVVYMWSRTA